MSSVSETPLVRKNNSNFRPRVAKRKLSQTETVEQWQGFTEMASIVGVFFYNHPTTQMAIIRQIGENAQGARLV